MSSIAYLFVFGSGWGFGDLSAEFSAPLDLATDAGAGRHVQYGFNVTGVNVWATDLAPFGSIVITSTVPEPGSLSLIGLGMIGLVAVDVDVSQTTI